MHADNSFKVTWRNSKFHFLVYTKESKKSKNQFIWRPSTVYVPLPSRPWSYSLIYFAFKSCPLFLTNLLRIHCGQFHACPVSAPQRDSLQRIGSLVQRSQHRTNLNPISNKTYRSGYSKLLLGFPKSELSKVFNHHFIKFNSTRFLYFGNFLLQFFFLKSGTQTCKKCAGVFFS